MEHQFKDIVQKIILRPFLRPHLASDILQFEKCPTLVLKYVNITQLLIISEGKGRYLKKFE